MSEEEFFNRLLNKIDKEFGYDAASTLELMFMTKEKKIEQLENIRKEAIGYINNNNHIDGCLIKWEVADLLNILNKGSEEK